MLAGLHLQLADLVLPQDGGLGTLGVLLLRCGEEQRQVELAEVHGGRGGGAVGLGGHLLGGVGLAIAASGQQRGTEEDQEGVLHAGESSRMPQRPAPPAAQLSTSRG